MVPTAPLAKSITPVMWIGISTSIRFPVRFSGLVITRWRKLARVEPVTRRTGPKRLTRATKWYGPMPNIGPPPNLIIGARIRVPALVPVAYHECRCRHRFTDPAIIDQLATGLDAAAEKRCLAQRPCADPSAAPGAEQPSHPPCRRRRFFSVWACFPASRICWFTLAWTFGTVRLTTISMSASPNS